MDSTTRQLSSDHISTLENSDDDNSYRIPKFNDVKQKSTSLATTMSLSQNDSDVATSTNPDSIPISSQQIQSSLSTHTRALKKTFLSKEKAIKLLIVVISYFILKAASFQIISQSNVSPFFDELTQAIIGDDSFQNVLLIPTLFTLLILVFYVGQFRWKHPNNDGPVKAPENTHENSSPTSHVHLSVNNAQRIKAEKEHSHKVLVLHALLGVFVLASLIPRVLLFFTINQNYEYPAIFNMFVFMGSSHLNSRIIYQYAIYRMDHHRLFLNSRWFPCVVLTDICNLIGICVSNADTTAKEGFISTSISIVIPILLAPAALVEFATGFIWIWKLHSKRDPIYSIYQQRVVPMSALVLTLLSPPVVYGVLRIYVLSIGGMSIIAVKNLYISYIAVSSFLYGSIGVYIAMNGVGAMYPLTLENAIPAFNAPLAGMRGEHDQILPYGPVIDMTQSISANEERTPGLFFKGNDFVEDFLDDFSIEFKSQVSMSDISSISGDVSLHDEPNII